MPDQVRTAPTRLQSLIRRPPQATPVDLLNRASGALPDDLTNRPAGRLAAGGGAVARRRVGTAIALEIRPRNGHFQRRSGHGCAGRWHPVSGPHWDQEAPKRPMSAAARPRMTG